ncbi:MAG TPA: ComF family protein [Allosphingosinicella sp.]|uniref:ComF family protein n=1 Tax=Allosphingosinicella sp. TaxID=2823234 RepID=UPI002ED865A5
MASAALLARGAVRHIVDFALPPRCLGCGAVTAEQHSFCLTCWQSLTFLGEPCCHHCGLPFEYEVGESVECAGCIADPPEFDTVRTAVAYGEIARKVALTLKYGGRPAAAATIAHFLQRHLLGEQDAILAPVPLHRSRIWRRGYNQSALIAQALSRASGLPVQLDLIRRVKSTPPLKGMSRRQRAETVRGAFHLAPGAKPLIAGRSVTLIDDVYTTGATVRACAKLLKREGAAQVNILCWARVVTGKDD